MKLLLEKSTQREFKDFLGWNAAVVGYGEGERGGGEAAARRRRCGSGNCSASC